MMIFASDSALIAIGAKYLKIAGWSYLLTGISQCYLGLMKVTEKVVRSAWISSGAVVLNIGLNAVFIFGLFGVPAMGAEGAVIATLLARIIELIWAVDSTYQKGFMRIDFKRFFHRNALLISDFWKCALPLVGGSLFWGVGFTSYTAIMGHMGSDAAAANSVSAMCMCGIAIPLALLGEFVFHWPVLAVYACTCLDEVGKIPWVMMHYKNISGSKT